MKSPEQELLDFLLENPHLMTFQNEIEVTMNAAGNDPEKRLAAFSALVECNKAELQSKMDELLRSITVLQAGMMQAIGGKFQ